MTPDENLQELQTQNTESPAPQKHRLPTIHSAIPAVLINITTLAIAALCFFGWYDNQKPILIQSGYDQGYSEGYDIGHQNGYDAGNSYGYDKGKSDGYDAGYSAGKKKAYTSAYEDGKTAGYNQGYSIGEQHGKEEASKESYNEGYEAGKKDGYNSGYSAGQSSVQSYSAPTSSETTNSASVTTDSYTVYVTKTGSKYHRAGCSYLRKSSMAMDLSEARKYYTPCSRCNPPS